jgi:hypothetical protein
MPKVGAQNPCVYGPVGDNVEPNTCLSISSMWAAKVGAFILTCSATGRTMTLK